MLDQGVRQPRPAGDAFPRQGHADARRPDAARARIARTLVPVEAVAPTPRWRFAMQPALPLGAPRSSRTSRLVGADRAASSSTSRSSGAGRSGAGASSRCRGIVNDDAALGAARRRARRQPPTARDRRCPRPALPHGAASLRPRRPPYVRALVAHRLTWRPSRPSRRRGRARCSPREGGACRRRSGSAAPRAVDAPDPRQPALGAARLVRPGRHDAAVRLPERDNVLINLLPFVPPVGPSRCRRRSPSPRRGAAAAVDGRCSSAATAGRSCSTPRDRDARWPRPSTTRCGAPAAPRGFSTARAPAGGGDGRARGRARLCRRSPCAGAATRTATRRCSASPTASSSPPTARRCSPRRC